MVRIAKPGTEIPRCGLYGYRHGADLARAYASGELCVPQPYGHVWGGDDRSDGLRSSRGRIPGDRSDDVVKEGVSGVLHEDLQTACHQAVQLPQDGVLEYARSFTWERTTDILLETLVSAKSD